MPKSPVVPDISWCAHAGLPVGKVTPHGAVVGTPKQQPRRKQPVRISAMPTASAGSTESASRHIGSRKARARATALERPEQEPAVQRESLEVQAQRRGQAVGTQPP